MRGAIMQPYFFPYIGYYQLAYAVQKFVFLDDVAFIKQGYINRNSILLGGRSHEFSLPVAKASSFRAINDHRYIKEYSKFFKMLEQNYRKAPYFNAAMQLVESVMNEEEDNVSVKNAHSIKAVFSYLDIDRDFLFSSELPRREGLKGQGRILDLCDRLELTEYINSIGGQALYSKDDFSAVGVELHFLKSQPRPYMQGSNEFIPNLSMIDVLMYCDKDSIRDQLASYALV
ncbi:MAG TPA: WbqC family protein [Pseudomonas sp.]|uniref:WbqC family protein n=1 Tax=Pseudomonas sp. TaxID=306 RepID=UPI002D07AB53|nr:WbqC family protein [Pseudomonas sp.]HRL93830.1 WbqC family protein [Pseudomonas sp.]